MFISHSTNQNPVPLSLKSDDPLRDQIMVSSNQIKISAAQLRPSSPPTYPQVFFRAVAHATLQECPFSRTTCSAPHSLDEFLVQRGQGARSFFVSSLVTRRLQKNPIPSRIRATKNISLSSKITGTILGLYRKLNLAFR